MHDANADLVEELRVPSDANDQTIQEALIRLFNAQDQDQSIVDEGQASRAQRSAQALKAPESVQAIKAADQSQFSSEQIKSELKSDAVQFKTIKTSILEASNQSR